MSNTSASYATSIQRRCVFDGRSYRRKVTPVREVPQTVRLDTSDVACHQDSVAVAVVQRFMRHDGAPINLGKSHPLVQPHRASIALETDQADLAESQRLRERKRRVH